MNGERGGVYDPAAAVFHHDRRNLSDYPLIGEKGQIKSPVPGFIVKGVQRTCRRSAGIVEEGVDGTELVTGSFDQGFDVLCLGHIAAVIGHIFVAGFGGDFFLCFFQLLFKRAEEHDFSAFRRQFFCNGFAKAGAGCQHQGAFIF